MPRTLLPLLDAVYTQCICDSALVHPRQTSHQIAVAKYTKDTERRYRLVVDAVDRKLIVISIVQALAIKRLRADDPKAGGYRVTIHSQTAS